MTQNILFVLNFPGITFSLRKEDVDRKERHWSYMQRLYNANRYVALVGFTKGDYEMVWSKVEKT